MTETNADSDFQRYKGSPLDLAGVKHHSVFLRESFLGFCHMRKTQPIVHIDIFRCPACYRVMTLFSQSGKDGRRRA